MTTGGATTTTYYVGNWFYVNEGVATSHYYFGGQWVAMRRGDRLSFLYGDHLGSTSVTTDARCLHWAARNYFPFGSASAWAGPYSISGMPGTGVLQAESNAVLGTTLWQSIWRGGQEWLRSVPIVNGVPQFGSASAWVLKSIQALLQDNTYWCWVAASHAGGSDSSPLGNATPVARDTERSGNCAPPPVDLASPARALNGTVTKYYYFGAQRVAMRTASGVTYLHGDHLGSTSVTSGASSSTQTYYPYGGVRTTSGTLPTDYTFTGQKLDASSGLMYYGARYYDAAIGRFAQPDSLVPNPYNPQSLNRYSYAYNNPLRYRDPTGHDPADSIRDFLNNTLLQWAYVNAPTAQAREACTAEMAKAQDPLAANAGRSFGNALAMWQAASEIVGGVGAITGGGATGLATCAETLGGGCLVGAGIAVGGAALATHGAAVGINALQEEIKLLGGASGNISMAKRTAHGDERAAQGDRPTGQAWNDAQKAGPSKVFWDSETGRYVVSGDKGRIHLFEAEGGELKLHTSFRNPAENTADRLDEGKWVNLSEDEFQQWQDLLEDALQ